jgi:hypothetical protein
MKNDFKITCPNCKKEFDAGSAFNAHFEKNKLENEKNLKIAQDEADKYKIQAKNNQKEIEKAKIEATKKAELDNAKNNQKEIEKAKIEATKKAELDNAKNNQKEIEKAKIEATKKAEKDVDLKAKKIAQEEIEKKDDEITKIKKERQISNERLKKRTEEMNSLMQSKKSELKGEIQEENLQDFLKSKFPDDNVDEIKKGAKGGDCILTINYKGRKNIAKIYFESKDTTSFNEKWCDKLLNDMKDKGIGNGIIVASLSCLPADIDKYTSYVERHGNSITIIPMEYKIIQAIVSKIRSILIFKARENRDHEIPDVMKKCWANLNSPNFQLPIKSMVTEIKAMEKIFTQERTSFERMAANKVKTINGVKTNLVKIVTSFTSTAGDIFPEDLLEHKDDKFID